MLICDVDVEYILEKIYKPHNKLYFILLYTFHTYQLPPYQYIVQGH